ncbi:hypothetical protein BBP40_004927 [Aspergillus hancockii]|nr:hypothetical protein BBP40_004927 [Aspergillus hancockii]
MPTLSSLQSPRLKFYLAWVHTWLHASFNEDQSNVDSLLDIDTICVLLQGPNLGQLLDPILLLEVVTTFWQKFRNGELTLGGMCPPSCEEINVLSEQYDPRVDCSCEGISSMSTKDADITVAKTCRSIEKMLLASEIVTERCREWNGHGLFTVEKLQRAVEESAFCNLDIQDSPNICSGASITSISPIKAPDRRPSSECDSGPDTFNDYFPTFEKIKLCVDAKYFYAIACGGSLVDEGILRAIADAGNDVLIGDYSIAFLKACNLAGVVNDWHLNILVAGHIQFRVLGYYRNHAVPKLPEGFYGSRTTQLTSHRHIDIANTVGVVAASLATGEQLDEDEYMRLSYGTTLINDLVDLRSDIMRKQRENPVLRGIRGSACQYLNRQVLDCIVCARELIESKKLLAMVTMAFCNWAVMASHHKLYELVHGVCKNVELHQCHYDGLEEHYDRLVNALQPYGSLGDGGPHWGMKRMELDKLYSMYRQSPETHSAWLADMVRMLLEPSAFRRIVDVVHYPWIGDVGEVEYCP